ncbi:hypothetical protein CJ195_00490 [Bacillus sp. UMB0899]|nr:hypothetical protein CJ195_00490 [Bacillus sp. UMB0899]
MSAIKHLPLPYFTINQDFHIIDASDIARDTFDESNSFLEIVDLESQKKALRTLTSATFVTTELVLKTKNSPYALFQIQINWQNNLGHIVCIEQDDRIQSLIDAVEQHRKRLSETNFELLEKKEQLEKSFERILELSVPMIYLAKGMILVPLIGELNIELVKKNHNRIVEKITDQQIERILIDFHGIGDITNEGIRALRTLVLELRVMGTDSYIIGVSPLHAKVLNSLPVNPNTYFLKDLHSAIRSFII